MRDLCRGTTPLTTNIDDGLIRLPRIHDPRGNLTFIEGGAHVPFTIARAYWIYDVPGGGSCGGSAYRSTEEFLVALSGSFEVVLENARGMQRIQLSRSFVGVHVRSMTWRRLENFSTNAVCLALASERFSESDRLFDRDAFDVLMAAGSRE